MLVDEYRKTPSSRLGKHGDFVKKKQIFNQLDINMALIIFDLDGTLIDSSDDLVGAMNETASKHGLTPLPKATFGNTPGKGGMAMLCVLKNMHQGTWTIDESSFVQDFRAAYGARHTQSTSIYPGVVDTLKTLRQWGIKTAICTNKPEHFALEICTHLSLTQHVDHVVGRTNEHPPKPSPDMVTRLRNEIQHQGPAIFVGDSPADQGAAKASQMPFSLFKEGFVANEVLAPDHSFKNYLGPGLCEAWANFLN